MAYRRPAGRPAITSVEMPRPIALRVAQRRRVTGTAAQGIERPPPKRQCQLWKRTAVHTLRKVDPVRKPIYEAFPVDVPVAQPDRATVS